MLRYKGSSLPIPCKRCEFSFPAPTSVPRALFAAEYPPTNSVADKPHANPTSRNIALHIGEGRADWFDVYPFAPNAKGGACALAEHLIHNY